MIRFAENLNKMITAGLGGALEAPRTEVADGHRVIYTEASGAVVNFESNVVAPVKNLRVTMEPIQDLHGQDAPYPAGGGKNLLDYDIVLPSIGFTAESDGVFYIANSSLVNDKTVWENTGAVEGSVSISYSYKYNSSTLQGARFKFVYSDGTSTENYAGASESYVSKTLTSDANKTLTKIIGTYGTGSVATWIKDIQVEIGTPTAWSPYENICPITGRDSVTVWREASYDPSADPALTIALGQTVYGGPVDVTTGVMKVDWANIASYDGETLPDEWISDRDVYSPGATPTTGAQVCYKLAEPLTIQLSPQTINSLLGQNNVWSDAGNISLKYPYYEETEGY